MAAICAAVKLSLGKSARQGAGLCPSVMLSAVLVAMEAAACLLRFFVRFLHLFGGVGVGFWLYSVTFAILKKYWNWGIMARGFSQT
jgi:hypothetical protein